MKYQTLNKKFLDRFWNTLNKKNRGIPKDGSPYKKCSKEVYVERVVKLLLKHRYYAIIVEEPTGYYKQESRKFYSSYDVEEIKLSRKQYIGILFIEYYLGWNEEIEIKYWSASSSKFHSIKLDDYASRKFKFKPISEKKYKQIQNLFEDDSVKKVEEKV